MEHILNELYIVKRLLSCLWVSFRLYFSTLYTNKKLRSKLFDIIDIFFLNKNGSRKNAYLYVVSGNQVFQQSVSHEFP